MGFTLIGYRDPEASRGDGGTTLRRRAVINADNDTETTISALAYAEATLGLVRGASHPSYTFAQLVNAAPSREERSHRVFYIDADYATSGYRTNSPQAEEENPLLMPSRRAFSTSTLSKSVTHSPITGAPLLNSASFLTPREWDFQYFVLTITRNEAIDTIAHYANYHDTLDSAGGANTGLLGAYPGEVLLKISHGEEQYKAGLWYMEVDYELHAIPRALIQSVFRANDDECPFYNANGSVKSYISYAIGNLSATTTSAYVSSFDILELQQAFSYWSVVSVGPPVVWKLIRFKDDNGDDSSEPQLLNQYGTRLLSQSARLGDSGEAAYPVFRAFTGKRRTNFADLNLLAV